MIECKHGYDNCPECDPKDFGSTAQNSRRRNRASRIAGREVESDGEADAIIAEAERGKRKSTPRKQTNTLVDAAAAPFGSVAALSLSSGVPLRTLMNIKGDGRNGSAALNILLAILAANPAQAEYLCKSAAERLAGR